MTTSGLKPLACPCCRRLLEPTTGRHGLVWLCRSCRAGAATLPVLRQVAPRTFVNHLWQTALHGGRVSTLRCPSCAQPFTELVGPGDGTTARQLEVCVGCFWVWLGPGTLSQLSPELPPPAPTRALARAPGTAPRIAAPDARRLLGSMTAGVLVDVL